MTSILQIGLFLLVPAATIWACRRWRLLDLLSPVVPGFCLPLGGVLQAIWTKSGPRATFMVLIHGHVSGGKVYGFPWFAGILRSMPIYSMWDDHDFGPNNSTSSFSKKNESRVGFMEMWANPSHGENGKGIYTRFRRGDVEFFLVDNRWFRTSSAYLGSAQMAWLKAGLLDARNKGAKGQLILLNDGRMKHVVIGQNGGFRVPDRQDHLRESIISPW